MNRKTKINVLLPIKMVGELEKLSKLGKRSQFITEAIRSKLDGVHEFDLWEVETKTLLQVLRAKANLSQDKILWQICDTRLEELK